MFALAILSPVPATAAQQPQEAPPAGPNLDALTASFLGSGEGTDRQHAIDIGRDRTVVVGGQVAGRVPGGRVVNLGGTTGTVVRLDPEGRAVRSVTRIGGVVDDLEINRRTGSIAVTGDFGVALLNESATGVLWQDRSCAGSPRRVATDHAGMVAALCGGQVALFQPDGNRVALFAPEHHAVDDVAVLDSDGTEIVVVTGHDRTANEERPDLQVAYVEAYDFRGQPLWHSYGWPGSEIPEFTANTRGVRVVRGHDRRVYLLAEADGPDNVFRALAQDPERPARLVGTDAYDRPDTEGRQEEARGPMLFLARLNADNGRQIAGRFVAARTPAGAPAPTYGRAVAADLYGNVVIGGMAECCLPQREGSTVAGQPVPPPGAGADGFVLSLDASLARRRAWTAWGQGGEVLGVVSVAGVAGMAATMTSGTVLTHEALPGQGSAGGNADGYFATWRSPEATEFPPGLTAEQTAAEAARVQEQAQTAAPVEGEEAVSPLAAADADAVATEEGEDNFLLVTLLLVLLSVAPAAVAAFQRKQLGNTSR